MSDRPDPVERTAKRVAPWWTLASIAIGIGGVGYGLAMRQLAWRIEADRVAQSSELTRLRDEVRDLRVDIAAEGTSRTSDRERLARLETELGIMPTTRILAIRAANKEQTR